MKARRTSSRRSFRRATAGTTRSASESCTPATVKVYRNPEEGYERVAEWRAEDEDTLVTPFLPDWALPLPELFRMLE